MAINLIKKSVDTEDDSDFLNAMRAYYKDVPESRVIKEKPIKDVNGEIIKDDRGKPKMKSEYKGKEEYYQWINIR